MTDLPAATPKIKGRLAFMCAIRWKYPQFWQSLYVNVLSGNRTIEKWAEESKLRDTWIIEILRDTVEYWRAHPDSPEARLHPGSVWFHYKEAHEPTIARPFAPTFDDPYLRFSGPPLNEVSEYLRNNAGEGYEDQIALYRSKLKQERLDEFVDRMTQQFRKQLAEHKRYLKEIYGGDKAYPKLDEHAGWTMLVFAGMTPAQIAEGWPEEGRQDMYETITKAVNRFAQAVGLTLPTPT